MGRKEGYAGNEVGRREQPGGCGGSPQPADVSRGLLVGQHREKTTPGYENDFLKRLSKQVCHGSQGKGWLGSTTAHLQEHSWELRTFPQGTGGRHCLPCRCVGLFTARGWPEPQGDHSRICDCPFSELCTASAGPESSSVCAGDPWPPVPSLAQLNF